MWAPKMLMVDPQVRSPKDVSGRMAICGEQRQQPLGGQKFLKQEVLSWREGRSCGSMDIDGVLVYVFT